MFVDEFTKFATRIIPEHNNNIFTGDFNLHVSDNESNDSAIFNDTIEAMDKGKEDSQVRQHTRT